MSEATGKTASCLAITEKRPHRPGGCVGIFFQLFDWNRRLAKKKLFSRKLLPPARGKQPAKEFGGDEKMPKTKPHLIANDNSGGFPSVKKNGSCKEIVEHKHEMKTASLVARLMGLESMPAVNRDKHKKVSNSVACDVKNEKFVNPQYGTDGKGFNMDNGSSKLESRPQKLQKTGQFDRRAVTRFGAEALQIRNVLLRSRKHHHPKLVSPVKSPRISSSRNPRAASRLIDAATRILEPRLQAASRAKCALTYPTSKHYAPKNEVSIGALGLGVMSPDLVHRQQTEMSFDVAMGNKSLTGHVSCKNCGNLLDEMDSVPTMVDKPFVCPSSARNVLNSSSSSELERNKPRPLVFWPDQERGDIYRQNEVKLSSVAEKLDHPRPSGEPIFDRKSMFSVDQMPQQFRSQHHMSPKDEHSSIVFRQRTETQNEMSVGRNRTPPRAKSNNLQSRRASSAANAVVAKDFVAMNKSVNGRIRPRVSAKSDDYMAGTERKICSRSDDSLPQLRSPARKRTVSGNAHSERTGPASSTSMRQKNVKCDLMSGKDSSHNANRASNKTRSASQGECNRANGNKNNNVVSFTFNSPLKHNATHRRKPISGENDVKTCLQRKLALGGDTLGAVLEKNLMELASQEEDESMIGGGSGPKRSTAMILQELISALLEQQQFSSDCHMFNADTAFQTQQRGTIFGFSHDADHPSPESVLEASFSNESCFSSSVDDNLGRRLVFDSVDYSCDLLDSPTSMSEGRMGSNRVTDLLNYISKILQSINLADGGLTGSRLTHVKEVILNAELLFQTAAPQNSDRMKSSFIGPFLLDELETISSVTWTTLNCFSGYEESKEGSKMRRFLFDSVIECLESKYSQYSNCGFKAWRRVVPSCINAEHLVEAVGKEIRQWNSLAGMIPDEIIEWEMSHSLGKWTDFEIEAFEAGCRIDWDILQMLVDEIVVDF